MVQRALYYRILLALTLGMGIGLSVMAALLVGKWEASNQQTRFQRQIENLATVLQRNLNRYTDVLAFLGDHYRVTQGQVKRQDFADFVERSLNTYPGIQALEWAPLVRQTERVIYEQTIQTEGYESFQITELSNDKQLVRAGDRPYYIPVTYIAPFLNNEAAFGFDLNSNLIRAVALESARDQGEITATGRIRLVQEQRDQFGFLVILPLYQRDPVPITINARREQFRGVLLGVFRISDVVEEALQDLSYDINFALYDQSAIASEQFLGQYDAVNKNVTTVENLYSFNYLQTRSSVCSAAIDCTRTITVGQRQWLVKFSPSEQYAVGTQYGVGTTLFFGFLLTGSLVLFLHNLNTELEQTKRLSDLKLQFFSMASHELRTPLSTILLSAESLQVNHHHLSEEQHWATIQRIHRTAKHMSQQITDLLTLTRAEAGKLEFNPELLNLKSLCQQAIEAVDIGHSQRIMFTCDGQNSKVFWDKKLARSLLTNLLSNALKYSPPHAVVQFNVCCDDHTAIIRICDRGIGIPASDLPYVQEAFHRGSNVGDVTGTGLGLSVVKTCVELHRGEWTIDSKEGQGTEVTVKLPLE